MTLVEDKTNPYALIPEQCLFIVCQFVLILTLNRYLAIQNCRIMHANLCQPNNFTINLNSNKNF